MNPRPQSKRCNICRRLVSIYQKDGNTRLTLHDNKQGTVSGQQKPHQTTKLDHCTWDVCPTRRKS